MSRLARVAMLVAASASSSACIAGAQSPLATTVAGSPVPRPDTLPANSPAAPSSRAPVEYAMYVGEGVDGSRVFATASGDVRGRNWPQFAQRLGAPRFPEYPRTEPAFFTWLAERGWVLVQCERREETVGLLGDTDTVSRCWFRRENADPASDAFPR